MLVFGSTAFANTELPIDGEVTDVEIEYEPDVSWEWPENTNGELPMAGIFYGNHANGVGLLSSVIAVESSRRFRAERSGEVTYMRYNNRVLDRGAISSRCARFGSGSIWCQCANAGLDEYTCGYALGSSYSVGNGGNIVVELRTNDENGLPSNQVLAKTQSFVPMDNQSNRYPKLNFTSPATIQEGEIYHLVFTNTNPPRSCALANVSPSNAASCPRNQGAIGLNGVRSVGEPSITGLKGPYHGDSAAANFYRRSSNSGWSHFDETVSWYEIGYSDGVAVGDSYSALDAMGIARQSIRGAIKARQVFTVQDASRVVDGLWLNFGHINSADGSAMNVSLKDASGSELARGTIQSSEYCRNVVSARAIKLSKMCQDWGYVSFERSVSLLEASQYSVELSANSGAGFILSAYEPLGQGFADRNSWKQARAEISYDNGANWLGWTQTTHDEERDLSLLFTIEGMPRQLR